MGEIKKRKYNTQNLIQNQNISQERRREICSKAGKISSQKKKERLKLKDELILLLSSKNYNKRICTALVKKACKGDIPAFTTIRDTIGEKQKESVENKITFDKLEDLL